MGAIDPESEAGSATRPARAEHAERPSRAVLVASLHDWDIDILQPGDGSPTPDRLDPPALIAALAADADPRLRTVLAVLFVRHPELSRWVPDLAIALSSEAGSTLRRHYTAAVYLQRLWRSRLALYLPDAPLLPDWFSRELGLPSPEERFGKVGLYVLAARSPYNLRASYDRMMALLFDQLRAEWLDEPAAVC
jgi:hypothetical protein